MKSESPIIAAKKEENALRNVLGQKSEPLTIRDKTYVVTPLTLREKFELEDLGQAQIEIQLETMKIHLENADVTVENAQEQGRKIAEINQNVSEMKFKLLQQSASFYARMLNKRKTQNTLDIDSDWIMDTMDEDELNRLALFMRSLDPKDLNPSKR
jgi:hypothetical protein